MNAVDTNVVVRFIMRDDPHQSALAVGQIYKGVFVSEGVLMETEWVLRSVAGWERRRVNEALRALLAIEQVSASHADHLSWALDRHDEGADWADMLHLIAAHGHAGFVTFDRDLARRMDSTAPVSVISLG